MAKRHVDASPAAHIHTLLKSTNTKKPLQEGFQIANICQQTPQVSWCISEDMQATKKRFIAPGHPTHREPTWLKTANS